MTRRRKLGDKGEKIASTFLKKRGYQIVSHNFRVGKLEIDIIAIKNNVLAFVEVKARSNNFFGNPEDFVDEIKQLKILQAAEEYIELIKWEGPIRFDIIAIVFRPEPEIVFLEDAF